MKKGIMSTLLLFGILNGFIGNVRADDKEALVLDEFLYQICTSSRDHAAHNDPARTAQRFYLSVKQACAMLENILAGFKEGIFDSVPQIQQGFVSINNAFGEYPKVAKLSKKQLDKLRTKVALYQAYLTDFIQRNRMNFTEQESGFILLLQRFNEFLMANILHEHYLPFMEEYVSWWQSVKTNPATMPALFFMIGYTSWLVATATAKRDKGEKVNSDDLACSIGVGALTSVLGYVVVGNNKN